MPEGSTSVGALHHTENLPYFLFFHSRPAFPGGENSYNLFTVRRNADAATDEDRSRLQARLAASPRLP